METESQAGSRPTGPFVAAAVFAEKVLQERDGTKSLIRIVDRVTQTAVGAEPPEAMPPLEWQATVFISLKPGQARGGTGFRILMESPDGFSREVAAGSFNFLGGPNNGADLLAPFKHRFEMPGVYWFDIEIDGSILTRMPLEILYERRVMPRPPNPSQEA
jgi:hypothetical protein